MSKKKNPSFVSGMDRQICPSGHNLASLGDLIISLFKQSHRGQKEIEETAPKSYQISKPSSNVYPISIVITTEHVFFLQNHLQEAVSHLSKSKDREEELTKSLREMEETAARVEKEKLQQQTHEVDMLL